MPGYSVDVAQAHRHRFRVTLTVPRPSARQLLWLPAWVPGSPVVRHMARHLSDWQAQQGGRSVVLEQRDTSSWVAHCDGGAAPLVVGYSVRADDASVVGAHIDAGGAFFDGSSLFVCAAGHEAAPHSVRLGALPPGWRVDTALDAAGGGAYQAPGWRALVDAPFLLGTHWRGGFDAGGAAHTVCVAGAWPSFDGDRLAADLARLCTATVAFWHGAAGAPPFERYVFLLRAGDDSAAAGLEHACSCVLAVARRSLPRLGGGSSSGEPYAALLALAGHEYFHAWLAMRLRPAELAAPDPARPAASRLAWFVEGCTSYCATLLLLRAGLVDTARCLQQLARMVATLQGTPGRRVQSVADAGFDAGTKSGDINASVSVYAKGALVALLCDLALRAAGSSLDALLRALWRGAPQGLFDDAMVEAALRSHGGDALVPRWRAWVHGTDELPLAGALATVGIALQTQQPPTLPALLGLRLAEGAFSGVHVRQVLRGSAAEDAGVAVGDELLAADGWRIRRLDDARQWIGADAFDLLLARDQRIVTLRLALPPAGAAPLPDIRLVPDPLADAAAGERRAQWLHGS